MTAIFFLTVVLSAAAQSESGKFSVAAATKMNVLYIGVDNPVQVMVAGVNPDQMTVSVTNGTIKKEDAYSYTIQPLKPGLLKLLVSVNEKGKWKEAGSMEFRVKRIPDPRAVIAGLKSSFKPTLFTTKMGIGIEMPNFVFDLSFDVVSYTVEISDSLHPVEIKVTGNKFTEEVVKEINRCQQGKFVYFTDIKVVGPDSVVRNLGTIKYKIN